MKQSKQEKKPKATSEKLTPENLTMLGNLRQKLYEDSVSKDTENFWLND